MRHLATALVTAGLAWLVGATPADAQNLYMDAHFGGSVGQLDADIDARFTGGNTIDDSDTNGDRSIVGGGAMGFRFPLTWAIDRELPRWMPDLHFRVEGEFGAGREYHFQTKGLSQLDVFADVETLLTSSFNGLFEVPFYRQWAFFGGLGIGAAIQKVDVDLPGFFNGDKEETVFTWNAQAGIEYHFDDEVSLGFGYRYVDLDDLRVALDEFRVDRDAGNYDVDVEAHEFMLKLRLNFYYF